MRRYPRYKSFSWDNIEESVLRLQRQAARQNASVQEDEIEQLRRNLGGCNDPDERALPFDKASDYAPTTEGEER